MRNRKKKGNVYLRDHKAGLLEMTRTGYRFTYYKNYLSLPNAQPVSLTLPLREKPYESKKLFSFFFGLLPEGWFLDITCRTLKIDPKNKFDLLLATCGDCVGAVTVFPAEESESI
ncbi:HipA N-terminal domain-containing protein [Desulfonema magnum]|uniref:HipA-like N-terminal domain-containing protein n=1 Tax=Desulfonema magnum TaxID=45655 RepID=A0A975BSI4_9BACT|nr:HipA N-terminal domain-containing protein [Desulfonema magnum]QTA90871.1 HipA-like N-terminal domain-containing protein [Desulfonema magnum]